MWGSNGEWNKDLPDEERETDGTERGEKQVLSAVFPISFSQKGYLAA